MPVAYFASLDDAETIEVVFSMPTGGELTLRLLVDSGFTGQSCFVLPADSDGLTHAVATSSQVSGALQGSQKRIVVSCGIASLAFQKLAIAITADTSGLNLPQGISGIVGLSFLRYFKRWGSERDSNGNWRFFLETD